MLYKDVPTQFLLPVVEARAASRVKATTNTLKAAQVRKQIVETNTDVQFAIACIRAWYFDHWSSKEDPDSLVDFANGTLLRSFAFPHALAVLLDAIEAIHAATDRQACLPFRPMREALG